MAAGGWGHDNDWNIINDATIRLLRVSMGKGKKGTKARITRLATTVVVGGI